MRILRWAAGVTVLLLAAGLVQAIALARDLEVTAGSQKWMLLFALWGMALLDAAALFILTWFPAGRRLAARLAELRSRVALPAPAAVLLAGVFAVVLPLLVLAPLPEPLAGLFMTFSWRTVIFWLAAVSATTVLLTAFPALKFETLLAGVALLFAVVHQVAVFIPDISTNPFSLGWSEASRYYYASLFASERIYGVEIPPSVLHPTRYWMQAAPFLVGRLPLWVHRLWQVVLWLGANGLAAWLLARRPELNLASFRKRLFLAAWAFLFLFQGPVWYHLVVIAGFLFWGIEVSNFRRTIAIVAAASMWAGVSRVNWIPFPAALAGLLYLIEVPQDGRSIARYLSPVFWWGLAGAAAGLASQYAYMALSGNPPDQFGSAFTSDLLWYRLFPNATYPLGVLPGILLVTLPVGTAVWWAVRSGQGRALLGQGRALPGQGRALLGQGRALPLLRWLGIAAILAVFFAGGLVVSAKIGGGSNLHNMDGYIGLLLAAVVFMIFGDGKTPIVLPRSVLALAVLVPVGFAVSTGSPVEVDDPAEMAVELAELKQLVETAAGDGGEVLFIAERHLLTFDVVEGVALVADYEKVFLMEMAMAANEAYLGRLEADLAAGRFALIVSDLVNFNFQDREDDFGEENNAWDRYVTYPLLCYYMEVQTFETARVEILAPKTVPECPQFLPVQQD